nr:uncharacterized protein LOC127315213 [Lolium perenne]
MCMRFATKLRTNHRLLSPQPSHDTPPTPSRCRNPPRLPRPRLKSGHWKFALPSRDRCPSWWPDQAPTAGRFGSLPILSIWALDFHDCVGPRLYSSHGRSSVVQIGYRRQMRDDVYVQEGGAVWRHGGIDGRSCKVNALISLEDGIEEDGGSNSCGVCVSVR